MDLERVQATCEGGFALRRWLDTVWRPDQATGRLNEEAVLCECGAALNPYERKFLLGDAIKAMNAAWVAVEEYMAIKQNTQALTASAEIQVELLLGKLKADMEAGFMVEAFKNQRALAAKQWCKKLVEDMSYHDGLASVAEGVASFDKSCHGDHGENP